MNKKTLLLITLVTEGGLYFLGLMLMNSAQLELRSVFNVSWKAILYAILLTLPMFVTLFLIERTNIKSIVDLKKEMDEKVLPIFSGTNLFDLAFIAFFAGVGEELFFRGWMQVVLADRFGLVVGIFITSLVFGFLHYLSSAYAVYAFITSIYLGIIYHLTGNVFIVMAIHAVYDFVALVYLVRKSKDVSSETTVSE